MIGDTGDGNRNQGGGVPTRFTVGDEAEYVGNHTNRENPTTFIWIINIIAEIVPLGDWCEIREIIVQYRVLSYKSCVPLLVSREVDLFHTLQGHFITW